MLTVFPFYALVPCSKGHVDCVELLLSSFADVSVCDFNEATPLHAACSAKSLRSVLLLLQDGAELEAETRAGFTPLFAAVAQCWADGVRCLIESGCNVNHRTIDDKSVLFYCRYDENCEILKILKMAGVTLVADDHEAHRDLTEKYIDEALERLETKAAEERRDVVSSAAVNFRDRGDTNGSQSRFDTDESADEETDGDTTIDIASTNPFVAYSEEWLRSFKNYAENDYPISLKNLARLVVCRTFPLYSRMVNDDRTIGTTTLSSKLVIDESSVGATSSHEGKKTCGSNSNSALRGIEETYLPKDVHKLISEF